jgi:hypothetical protein
MMNAATLLLLSIGSAYLGFIDPGPLGMGWYFCGAVFLAAAGVASEVQMLRSEIKRARSTGKVQTPREWPAAPVKVE